VKSIKTLNFWARWIVIFWRRTHEFNLCLNFGFTTVWDFLSNTWKILKGPKHWGFSSTFRVHQYQTHFHIHVLREYKKMCYLWNKRQLQWDQLILLKLQHACLSAGVVFAPLLHPAKVRSSNLDHIQYSTVQCTGNAQSLFYTVPNIHNLLLIGNCINRSKTWKISAFVSSENCNNSLREHSCIS